MKIDWYNNYLFLPPNIWMLLVTNVCYLLVICLFIFFSLFDMIERHYHGNQPVATFKWLFTCFSPFPPHMYTLRSQWDLKEGKINIAAFWSLAQVWTVFQEMKKILLYSVTYFVFAIFWLYVLYLASLQNATDTQHKCTHTQFACW